MLYFIKHYFFLAQQFVLELLLPSVPGFHPYVEPQCVPDICQCVKTLAQGGGK